MTDQTQTQLTLVCYKCKYRFDIVLQSGSEPQVTYVEHDHPPQTVEFIFPKIYIIPCPECQSESEVML